MTTPKQQIEALRLERDQIRAAWDAAAEEPSRVCDAANAAYLAATGDYWDCDRRPKDAAHAVLWDRCERADHDRDAVTRPYRRRDSSAVEKIEAIEEQARKSLLMLRGMPWADIREEIEADPAAYLAEFIVPESGYYADFSAWLSAMHRTGKEFAVPVQLTADGKVCHSNTNNSLGICWYEVGGAARHAKWTSDDFRG